MTGRLVAKRGYSLPYYEPLLLAAGRPFLHTASENNLDTFHLGATDFHLFDQACKQRADVIKYINIYSQ